MVFGGLRPGHLAAQYRLRRARRHDLPVTCPGGSGSFFALRYGAVRDEGCKLLRLLFCPLGGRFLGGAGLQVSPGQSPAE